MPGVFRSTLIFSGLPHEIGSWGSAWCLISGHFHLVVVPLDEDGFQRCRCPWPLLRDDKPLASHRSLFCDIRGFTAFCEAAEPEETIEVLQTYHEEMGKLMNAHGAGVDHRLGFGVGVFIGLCDGGHGRVSGPV